MKTLGLCILVKDEYHLLNRCLNSCYKLFDEIIVVNTRSKKEKVVEVVKKYNGIVKDFKWVNDFSIARNFSFSKSTTDFVLWLDSDDVIKEVDFKKIQNLKENNFNNLDVLFFKYEYDHDQNDNVTLSHYRERIVKKSCNFKWMYPIHEIINIDWSKHKNQYFDISVHHYREKFAEGRNLEIFKEIMKNEKNQNDPRLAFYYGKELYWKDKDKAYHWLKYFVEMNEGYFEDRWEAYCKLGHICLEKEDIEAAKKHYLSAINIEERKAEPYCYIGDIYFRRQEWERAKHWYNLALQLERPKDSLGISLMEYYTWYPHLQIGVCWYYLGNIYKSIYHNNKCLFFNPTHLQALKNKEFLKARIPQKKKLHLGCGSNIKEGYLNTDIYKGSGIDEIFSMSDIPYKDDSFEEIYCEHALEHLDHYEALEAIKEMNRILQPGGKLILKIPNLEECLKNLLSVESCNINGYKSEDWYKYTIFGIQKSTNGEPKESQFHRTGFLSSEIIELLEKHNFIIYNSKKYDGYGTPSLSIEAYKKSKNYKVHFYAAADHGFPSTRLRCINVVDYFKQQGIDSIVSSNKLTGYNIIIFKFFNKDSLEWMIQNKSDGKKIYVDISEDILSNEIVQEMLKIAHGVICCSEYLKDKISKYNRNCFVVEEAWE